MRRILLVSSLALFTIIAFAQERRIVLQGVHIVDVEKGIIRKDQSVAIQGDRIVKIGNTGNFSRLATDSNVLCSGQYLVPGLWDMHTHVWMPEYFFTMFIANGVTGIRGMFENAFLAGQWKNQGNTAGTLVPTGFYAGPIVDGPKPTWPGSVAVDGPETGRKVVDSLKNKLKVDFVKVYSSLTRDAFFAIADEAKKQQIVFAGHVPNSVSVLEAAQAGQKSMEHMYGLIEQASDSSDFYFRFMRGEVKDSTYNNRLARRALLNRTFNEKKLVSIINEMKKTGTWICPTMTVNRGIAYINDPSFAADPRMKYVPATIKNTWNPANDFRFRGATEAYFENERKEYELKKRIIKLLHQGGIKLLAGTDTPNPYCYPGFSIHDELQILVDCGLSPAEALKTATIHPAVYLGIDKDYGDVTVGKIASLVLLKENPLENIANTSKIASVVLRGRFIGSSELDEMMKKAAKIAGN